MSQHYPRFSPVIALLAVQGQLGGLVVPPGGEHLDVVPGTREGRGQARGVVLHPRALQGGKTVGDETDPHGTVRPGTAKGLRRG